MMLLIPGNAATIAAEARLDRRFTGFLLTTKNTQITTGLFGMRYGVDNECYSLGPAFDQDRFLRALERIAETHGTEECVFVTAPDVVGDAQATLERAEEWLPLVRSLGFPAALAAQDGLERERIPWAEFDAIFVGGTTEWKLGEACATIMADARSRGKWLHVGRVNSEKRWDELLVKPDSVDGTKFLYSRNVRWWVRNRQTDLHQKRLPLALRDDPDLLEMMLKYYEYFDCDLLEGVPDIDCIMDGDGKIDRGTMYHILAEYGGVL
jgi:hypothetical protein